MTDMSKYSVDQRSTSCIGQVKVLINFDRVSTLVFKESQIDQCSRFKFKEIGILSVTDRVINKKEPQLLFILFIFS
jgi:hypothetical protein